MEVPSNAIEFNDQFNSEEACLEFLKQLRWPHGFMCPNCSHDDGYFLTCRPLIQCVLCRHQTSVTAGTLFHKTHLPLRIWFYMIFQVSSDKGGASSSRLASELNLPQKTVWNILHKIRHAMGRRDETISLAGFIEMDEAIIGPHARRPTGTRPKPLLLDSVDIPAAGSPKPKQKGRGRPRKKGPNPKTQTPVLVLVEQEPQHAGFVAMRVLDHIAREDILEFVKLRVDECQHIKTDGWLSHHVLRTFNCTYEAVVCSGPDGCIELPIVHRTISLLKNFLMGTYWGVSVKYLHSYLQEFSFRFNRRDTHYPLWLSLLRACAFGLPFTCAELKL
jgi:hypothetical protein